MSVEEPTRALLVDCLEGAETARVFLLVHSQTAAKREGGREGGLFS